MSMFGDISLGVGLFAVGVILIVIGIPKHGETARFLRFDIALVLYPSVILMFMAFGVATILRAL